MARGKRNLRISRTMNIQEVQIRRQKTDIYQMKIENMISIST